MTLAGRDKTRAKRGTTRLRIFVWALAIAGIAGIIGIAEPLEDLLRGGRNLLRQRPADGKVVVVAIDDKSVAAFGSTNYSRNYDAIALEKLAGMGAKHIYFDRVFSDRRDDAGDAAFAAALAKYRGRVSLGAMSPENALTGEQKPVLPSPAFRSIVDLATLNAANTPFSLSVEVVYADHFLGRKIPSISAAIAGVDEASGSTFRPDWSILVKSIPSFSYSDVIAGNAPAARLRGKDVLIGRADATSQDVFQIVGQGWFPGVYAHAIGAQTLREGVPVKLGWLPAFVLAACLAAMLLRSRSKQSARAILLAAVATGILVPFVLDMNLVNFEMFPAILLFGIVAYRSSTVREIDQARLQNAGTLLPNLSALREEPLAAARPIVAMRIRNYAAVCASFAEPVEDDLVTEIARRLSLPGETAKFYQAEDVLYWLGPELSNNDLEGHIAGLVRLVESQFVVHGRKLDIHAAFGIDVDRSRAVANRIGRALLAADTAAARNQPFLFNTTDNDEESAWELSLMSELDAAIEAGDIWIAFQPQYDLRTDAIAGAEALVRWQHPVRGAISPEAFILPAEAHNRIFRLTLHILELATAAGKSLLAVDPGFRLSVNISANLLEQHHLPAKITEILIKTGYPASRLTLEVTESAPFSESSTVAANLAGLSAIGIEMSIDDYGTGNATLDYLRSVPCQEIKIDRRFISGLVANTSDRLLVESTIELAHGLGRRVIAEGIEDGDTLARLRAMGCDMAQGYFLARPMRLDALLSLVAADPHRIAA